MGVHTRVDTLGTCGRNLVMVEMCSAPPNTHILTAQTPLSKKSATFLKTISFWDTLYISDTNKKSNTGPKCPAKKFMWSF